MTRHGRALLTAAGHYILTLVVGVLVFALAWGSGLSDSYTGNSGVIFFAVIFVLLQAPVGVHLNTVLSWGSKVGPNGGCVELHQARRGYEGLAWTRTVRSA